jgi:2-dehydro-3-deoxyphosphogluconate aldolase/(4S)-4-hydroxy-2-oxoglutarate aldolase
VEDEQKTLARIRELGLIAVVRGESREAATEVSSALIEGGVLGIEIAFTTPEAYRVMEDISNEYGERVLLGAGTVPTAEQAERAVSAGAKFPVSPGCEKLGGERGREEVVTQAERFVNSTKAGLHSVRSS